MTSSQPHYAARRAVALTCGLFALSYMRQRRRSRRLPARSPLANLDARQAMTALKIAHIISVVAMAVYASYYVDAMMQFWVPQ